MERENRLIAIVGGSGSGKTWLADRLSRTFGIISARLSLDDFYQDRSPLPPARRAKINFDHPRAIDWALAERVLRDCRAGRPTEIPRYNFSAHTRLSTHEPWTPTPLVLVDGLWLLWRPAVRALFDLRIYLDCPAQLRLERRLARDVAERGRSADSVREQFWRTVAPMHDRYVAPQAQWAHLVLEQPSSETELQNLVCAIEGLLPSSTLQSVSRPGSTGVPGATTCGTDQTRANRAAGLPLSFSSLGTGSVMRAARSTRLERHPHLLT